MSTKNPRKQPAQKPAEAKPAEEQAEKTAVEQKQEEKKPVVKITNRTNQKHVVAPHGMDNVEFLAGQSIEFELTKEQAEERFSIYLKRNVLIIN